MSLRSVPRTPTGPPLIVPAAGVSCCVAAVFVGAWLTRTRPVAGISPADVVIAYGVPTARALLLVGVTAVVGLSLVPVLVGGARSESPTERAARRHTLSLGYRTAVVASICWLAAALLALVWQAAEVSPATGATVEGVLGYLREFGGAQALVGSAVAALLAAASAVLGARAPTGGWHRGMLVAAGLGLLPLIASTHSGELAPQWHGLAMISLQLHVFAATAWAGGLAAVAGLLLSRPVLLARALPRFSGLAALCLVAVALSGLLNAVVELAGGGPAALVSTPYGLLVLGKCGCLGVVACLAARIRYRLLPLVVARRPAGLAAWLTAEVAVLGIAFGLAAVLGRTGVG